MLNRRTKQFISGVLLVLMFLGLMVAVPSGTLTADAQKRYLNEAPAGLDDEYSFLFEDEGD